jgi:hypothetical protein
MENQKFFVQFKNGSFVGVNAYGEFIPETVLFYAHDFKNLENVMHYKGLFCSQISKQSFKVLDQNGKVLKNCMIFDLCKN